MDAIEDTPPLAPVLSFYLPRPPFLDLVQMSILRDIKRAKTLLKAVGSITQSRVPPGSIVVKQGDLGDSMYTVVKVGGLVVVRNACRRAEYRMRVAPAPGTHPGAIYVPAPCRPVVCIEAIVVGSGVWCDATPVVFHGFKHTIHIGEVVGEIPADICALY